MSTRAADDQESIIISSCSKNIRSLIYFENEKNFAIFAVFYIPFPAMYGIPSIKRASQGLMKNLTLFSTDFAGMQSHFRVFRL